MTVSIALGWWLAPAMITILSYGWAIWSTTGDRTGGDYAMIGNAISALVCGGAATIVSLIAWLIWALLV